MGKLIRKRASVYDAFQVKENTTIFEITDWLKAYAPNTSFHGWGHLKVGSYILAQEGSISGTFDEETIKMEFMSADILFDEEVDNG